MASNTLRWNALLVLIACLWADSARAAFQAGACAVDVTPPTFPVVVNGNFLPVIADKANDRLHARWLVLDNGRGMSIALCVVDSCLMPRELLDDAKEKIARATGLRPDRILISATHTHSAPSVMGCLGTDPDPNYPPLLVRRLVDGAEQAVKNLAPAKVGHASVRLPQYTHCRQWVYRPDRMLRDPFGDLTVRANMHPGYQNASVIGPTGPSDPELSVLAVQGTDGHPIAMLANYSMHYFGAPAVSSDYYGLFCEKLEQRITSASVTAAKAAPTTAKASFVAIMSQGTSGDQHWMDYGQPEKKLTMDEYAQALADGAMRAYESVSYRDDVTLAMVEKEMRLPVRAPDAKRLAWARDMVSKLKDGKPTNQPEIYAREQVFLHDKPFRDVKLQAIRIGDVGIAAIPCEVFALTGLKLKAQSPLEKTFTIELANGEEGYIPPPELHALGGYTTWPARTACLEVGAEPKIVEAELGLLEQVSGQKRRGVKEPGGPYVDAVLASKPKAYWRCDEMVGARAVDATTKGNDAAYEPGILHYLEGPQSPQIAAKDRTNRAVHLAGGRMRSGICPDRIYSVSFWFWNGLSDDARPVTAYLFSHGKDGDPDAAGDDLGIGGTSGAAPAGKLFFFNGNKHNQVLAGRTKVTPRAWHHVLLVRDGTYVAVYLDGNRRPEIEGDANVGHGHGVNDMFLGGRNDNVANLEGRIDEVALYDRALTADEAAVLYGAAGMPEPVAVRPPVGATLVSPSAITNRATQVSPLQHGVSIVGLVAQAEANNRSAEADPTKSIPLHPDPPKSPAESLASIRLKDGFEVELVAAEPLVVDPVAIAWGPDGKLWVAEMADYPYGVSGDMKKPGGSRIRYLEDTDGDGKYDKSTLFMEGVNFPTGVMAWRKGVLVTAAPEIFYAEDTDGDGKADKKEVLYSGFTEGNPQLRVNGLRWGFDNWIYCANGWSSKGKAKSHKTGAEVQVDGRDIRIRPDTGEIETESGMSEFGRDPDDWGDWFGCDNSHPMWHFVLSDRYTRRNPHVPPPDPREQLMMPFPPKLYPISKAEKRYHGNDLAGYFQSACSATVYRDELLFGSDQRGPETQHVFVCDPVHNVVHHEVMTEDGVSFKAARAEDEKTREFLASTDAWFRPVMAQTGPDGALWVVDMYRFMIEHPDWLPQLGKDELRPYYRLGEDKGRIYRVYPKGRKPRPIPRMDRWRTIELARAGPDSPSGWQRDMAQQILQWKRSEMIGEGTGESRGVVYGTRNPLARLHALGVLDGFGTLKPDVVEEALRDEHPAVRRFALRLAEPRAKDAPSLIAAAAKLAADPDAKVRLQLACTLGEWEGSVAGAALAQLAQKDGANPYMAAAIMSSAVKHFPALVDAALKSDRPAQGPLFEKLLEMALATNDRDATARLLEPVVATGQIETFSAWVESVRRKGLTLKRLADAKPGDALARRLADAGKLFDAARSLVTDASVSPNRRAAAATLIGWSEDGAKAVDDAKRLAGLLAPQTPADVQESAVRAVGRLGGAQLHRLMIPRWPGLSPAVRGAVADVLLATEPGALELLQAVGNGSLSPRDLDTPRRQRLLNSPSQKVKAAAQKLLGGPTETSREKVVAALRPVLLMKADAKHGKAVFVQNCAVCHMVRDVGQEVGPPLLGMAGSSAEALLVHILDPNRQVDPKYVGYNATLASGEVVFGVITSETGNSITMKGLDGKARPIPRSDLKALSSTNRSVMPDGFESGLTKQDLADVIRFLQAPDEAP